MSSFDRRLVPRLRPGYRLQWEPAQQAHVLLYPEGMVRLNDSAGAIASLIDGRRSVADIVAELEARYPGVAELGDDVQQFMEVARDKFWLQLA
jgi:pyrroloquinoline quinone biosynthesis protein D